MTAGFKLLGSVVVLIFVILFPTTARTAVLEAMSAWAFSFVPALLPVFVVSPALAGEAARGVYAKVFGAFSQKLFGVSGPAFAAVAVGLAAGSPAGCSCLSAGNYKRNELCRAGIMASGLSPAFLSCCVGGLLNSPDLGVKLALSQLLAILSAGWLLRGAWRDDEETASFKGPETTLLGGMAKACVDIAGVLCWMALFGLIAAMLGALDERLGAAALPLLEIAGGASRLARADMPFMTRAYLAAFFCGLGGMCVAFQNLARLKAVPIKRFALGKLLHAALTTLYFQALLGVNGLDGIRLGYSPWPAMTAVTAVFLAGSLLARVSRLTSPD